MKVVLFFVFGIVALQSAYSQCIPATAIVTPITSSNSVGVSLADTLSLLTVSSLLSDKLPYGYSCANTIAPIAPITSIAPVIGNCGCGGYGTTITPVVAPIAPVVSGCGCGYGTPYSTYVL